MTLVAVPLTRGPRHHFFGYYDKCPWDATGRYVVALEAGFRDRRPGPDDEAVVGLIDTAGASSGGGDVPPFEPLAATRAWNWQQGCMLQWLPGAGDEIVFNDRDGDRFVSVILNVHTGARRTLPRPVYAVSPNGREAISLSFSRLFDVRPGYGYAGVPDPYADQLAPDEDGLWRLDLATGSDDLVFSLAGAAALGHRPPGVSPGEDAGKHRFNHVQFNPDGSRFAFLHRWTVGREVGNGLPWLTCLFTMAPDGGEGQILSDHGMVSHYDWRDANHLLAWAHRAEVGNRYFLFTDQWHRTDKQQPAVSVVGEGVLTVDGHCSFTPAPDKRWLLTDTYPDPHGFRTLILFDTINERRQDAGRFFGPTPADGEIRCDLHPRFSRDGRRVCVDSVHEGTRQMYVLDVEKVIENAL